MIHIAFRRLRVWGDFLLSRGFAFASSNKGTPYGIVLEQFAKSYERRYPKAAACMRSDRERLFAYYRFPEPTWAHLRTTNPIESIFSPIRKRPDAMKRLRTAESASAVTFALIQSLSKNWRPEVVSLYEATHRA